METIDFTKGNGMIPAVYRITIPFSFNGRFYE
jgi:hypothetical protein